MFKILSLFFTLFCSTIVYSQSTSSWKEVKQNGQGDIIIYWETSTPFIYQNTNGQLVGIEYEIMENFKLFLKQKYNVNVNLHWQKTKNFNGIINTIAEGMSPGIFGASAFSYTFDRRQKVNFSPTYMSDISVMISSKNIPIVNSPEDFDRVFNELDAITIKATTYESDLIRLKTQRSLDYNIELIPSNDNILKTIGSRKNAFGYIDLPIYLMAFSKNTTLNVKRQNIFPIKREGYGIIYPKNSDWSEPVAEYFSDMQVRNDFQRIIRKYIDYEIYNFIERYYEDNVSLLTKEKEIQNRELLNNALQIQQATNLRYGLVVILIITLVFAVIVYLMYQKRHKVALQLELQNQKIESQRVDIEHQKQQLKKRNELMTQYNNEKNNLIKILAHDLRTPINHIQGLANVFKVENSDLSPSNADLIDKIINSSERLLAMITKILDIDAIEENRVNLLEEKIAINDALSKVVSSFDKEAANKSLNLHFEPVPDGAYTKADFFYLTEVFENLISNAIKFSENGKSITVSVDETDEKFIVKIVDEGPGFSEDDMKLLFKKFQPLSARPTGGEQSTGLGLSIVKKYIELMGGSVWCESELGKGSTFYVGLRKYKV